MLTLMYSTLVNVALVREGRAGPGRVGWFLHRFVLSLTSLTEEEKLQNLAYCRCPMDSAHLVTFNHPPGNRPPECGSR